MERVADHRNRAERGSRRLSVTVLVNGVSSNAATFTVTTVTTPNYSLGAAPATLTVNRGANGAVSLSITRTGGFTGRVAFSAAGLPAGVTAAASPASTTGNTSTVTFTASSGATLGNGQRDDHRQRPTVRRTRRAVGTHGRQPDRRAAAPPSPAR